MELAPLEAGRRENAATVGVDYHAFRLREDTTGVLSSGLVRETSNARVISYPTNAPVMR